MSDGVFVLIFWLFAIIVYGLVCGIASKNIVKKKGYNASKAGFYFAAGFLFGLLGINFALFAHDLNEEKNIQMTQQNLSQAQRLDELIK